MHFFGNILLKINTMGKNTHKKIMELKTIFPSIIYAKIIEFLQFLQMIFAPRLATCSYKKLSDSCIFSMLSVIYFAICSYIANETFSFFGCILFRFSNNATLLFRFTASTPEY